jgi:hypothetical protein
MFANRAVSWKAKEFGDELQAVFIQTSSGVVLKIESCEVEAAPFEAYSLRFTLHSGDGRSWPDYESPDVT